MRFDVKDKVITLENGNKYIVIETVSLEDEEYAYLVNKDNELDIKIVVIKDEDGLQVYDLDEKFKTKVIFPLFLEKFKKY